MAETKSKKPKFKYTRELVRIAIDDGMTQKQIGDLCRVEQSIVSGWLNGRTRAFEHQIAELKKRYGNRLNRTTSRVYLKLGKTPSVSRWEDTERARTLLALLEESRKLDEDARARHVEGRRQEAQRQKERRQKEQQEPSGTALYPARPMDEEEGKARSKLEAKLSTLQQDIRPAAWLSIEELIRTDQDNFAVASQQEREHLTQVEGPIVLRYTFVTHKLQRRRDMYELEREPVARWVVHHQPHGNFVLIHQERRLLEGQSLWHWEQFVYSLSNKIFGRKIQEAMDFTKQIIAEGYIECADDAARWLSSIHGPMDAAALLAHSDAYFQDPKTLHSPHDERTLPFLLRKMLVEHGHDVPGLVRISDKE